MFCLCSLPGVWWCLVLYLSLSAILSLFLCMVWGCVLISLLCMQLSRFPSNAFWIDFLFPILCSCLHCQRLIDHKITSKNKLKMAGRLKSKTRHHQTPRREHRQNILWYQPYKCFLRSVSQGNRNKSKNKPMGPKQTDQLFHSKGNQKENKKTTYRMGENSFKRCKGQGLNL